MIGRLIDSAAALDWDRGSLEIQILDDSDDGSSVIVSERVSYWRGTGVPIQHVRRRDRRGFKAGALEAGLARSQAEFVAVFDADFVIPSDFLRQTVPQFRDPRLGMVQARWGFLNERKNLLTRIQALLLDGHFHVEHRARARAGRFFNFNGTAGIWRRSAIDDSGGWRARTVTEDLDLSLRAWLRGWRFDYRDDLVAPSSLPEAMSAFKIQQNRWVSGSVQTALMLLGSVLRSPLRPLEKVDLFFYLTGNFIYLPLLLLALSIPPAVLLRLDSTHLLLWLDLPFFLLATLSVLIFYTRARSPAFRGVGFFVLLLPSLMALGLGMSTEVASTSPVPSSWIVYWYLMINLSWSCPQPWLINHWTKSNIWWDRYSSSGAPPPGKCVLIRGMWC